MKKQIFLILIMICIFVKYKYVKAENNMEYGNPSNYLLYDGLNTIYYKNEIRTINQKYEKMLWIKADTFIGYRKIQSEMIDGPSDELVFINAIGDKNVIEEMVEENFFITDNKKCLIYQPAILIKDYNTIKSKTIILYDLDNYRRQTVKLDIPSTLILCNKTYFFSKIDNIIMNHTQKVFILNISYGNQTSKYSTNYNLIRQIIETDDKGKIFKVIYSTGVDETNNYYFEIVGIDRDDILYSVYDRKNNTVFFNQYNLQSRGLEQVTYQNEYFSNNELSMLVELKKFAVVKIYCNNGDMVIALYDKSLKVIKNLYSCRSWTNNVTLSPDFRFIAFTKEIDEFYEDIFIMEIKTKRIWQVTKPRSFWSKISGSKTARYNLQWERNIQ